MLSEQRSQLTGLAVAIALVAVVTGVIFGLREAVPVVSTGVVYLLPVLIVSIYWGVWMGLATSLLSAAAFNFFHLPPTGNFTISDGENWVALAVFFTIAVIASTLADAARNRQIEAELRRREADLVAEMARVMLSGESLEDSLREAGQRIASAYDLPAVTVSLEWVASEQRMVALPLLVQGERAGTLLIPRDTPEDVAETIRVRIVPALEALVGAARRRSELEAQVVETRALRHSNVLKTTMLRSVSHDLRSPLTAISAAAGGLQSDTLSDEERRELTAVISTEAARLARLVDNVLDLSRLQAGAAAPRTDWCSIEEVVREAVASVTAPPKGFDISLDDDLPLIRADAAQLERALANVLENAARHAGETPGHDSSKRPGEQAAAQGQRCRLGYRQGGARARVRAVSHRTGPDRPGIRARSRHRARVRRAERGPPARRLSPGAGNDLPVRPAARHGRVGACRHCRRQHAGVAAEP